MEIMKFLIAFVQSVFGAKECSITEQSSEMIARTLGKTTKEIELEKEVKKQARILEAQKIAKEELGINQ